MSDKLKNLEDTNFKKIVGEASYETSPKANNFIVTPPKQ
jgi:hypothetical protein